MSSSETAHTYQQIKHFGFFVGLALDLIVLLLLGLSGWTFAIKDFAFNISDQFILTNAIYITIFSLIMLIVHFPLAYFFGFYWEHQYNLSNQSLKNWLADELKKNLLGFVFGLILIEVIYIILRQSGADWWIWASAAWIFFSFLIAKITPNFIIPLFYKYSDLNNEDLKSRIRKLFAACHIPLKDVYGINFSTKTKKANAFVCGVGKNRRVVLSDTLLEKFSNDEIETVIAHELAHYKHHDVVKLLVLNSIVIFTGMFIVSRILVIMAERWPVIGIYDIALFPAVAFLLLIFGLIVGPFLNAYSRFIERKADLFSLEITKKPNDFISMMKKLGDLNLSEMEPSKFVEIFFYDHPTLKKRIDFAKQFLAHT